MHSAHDPIGSIRNGTCSPHRTHVLTLGLERPKRRGTVVTEPEVCRRPNATSAARTRLLSRPETASVLILVSLPSVSVGIPRTARGETDRSQRCRAIDSGRARRRLLRRARRREVRRVRPRRCSTPASSIRSSTSSPSSPASGRALELGIGTGRIALPLAQRGVPVHGIDMSEAMVARLRAKPGGEDDRRDDRRLRDDHGGRVVLASRTWSSTRS